MFDITDATFYIFLNTLLMFSVAGYCAYEAATTPRRHADMGLFWGVVGPVLFGMCGFSILLA